MNSNMDIYMENRLYFSCSYFVLDEKKLYFSNKSFNALVIVDRETWNVESMVPFVGEALETRELHSQCYRLGNKICFLPQGKKKLHVYDMESGEQKAYELEGEYKGSQRIIWHFHTWQNKMYLLPCGGQLGLWSLDFDGNLSKENWWEVHIGTTDFFMHGVMDEQRFYSMSWQTWKLTITDLEKKKTKTYQLPDEKVISVVYDGQDFWYITSNSGDIVRWNPEHGEREKYSFPIWDKCTIDGMPYAILYAAGQEIFVVSGTGEELFLLDKEERVLKQVFRLPEMSSVYKSGETWPVLTYIGDKLIWTFWNASGAAVIDLTTMEGKMYQDMISMDEQVRDYFDRVLLQHGPLFIEDSDGWNLGKFLDHCENAV